jgi:mono/diheme cytochrome c family protein
MPHMNDPQWLSLGLIALAIAGRAGAAAPAAVEFNRDVRAILSDNCFACHGPDKGKRKADLRLDVEADAFADRGGYRALVAGKPDQSELFRRITEEDSARRMPPAKSGKHLTPRQVELIRLWIAQGGKWQKHWSLIPPKRPPLPASSGWGRNAIDRFVLARLTQEGLRPSPEADRRTFIRRLSFDLTGLPPTPAEVDAFLADRSTEAYEKVVDRLLASPHYGERMALYWLDVVRYADTGGYHSDNHRDVWPYRDYVIAAFNNNKPFDRFTVEQLAGDLLPNATTEQKIASGYNRLLQTTEEGGAQAKEYTAKYQADRVRNTATIWLGTTMGCTECHDHKFDPFKTREFYQFAAFFADVKERAVGRQEQTRIPTPEQEAKLKNLDAEAAALRRALKAPPPVALGLRALLTGLERRRAEIDRKVRTTLITVSVPPRVVRVLRRGNWMDDSGEVVQPATPESLPPLRVAGRRATRLDLARWLTAPEHPLTARVFVNRLWKLMFARGLVSTLDDFGAQGAWPAHPDLLDWLAVELRDGGWDVKHVVKLMVMSATYRQSSQAPEALLQRDPYNHLLARQARYRLDAEVVRDNALAVSGLLVRKVGGPSVKPYQPAGYWQYLNFPVRTYVADRGPDQYRRGLYTYWQRTFPHPSLLAFDAPSREECTVERPRSNTPLQALVLLNDPTYVEAARALAERVLREGGRDVEGRLHFAYRQVLSRKARPEEVRLLTALHERHLKQYRADPKAAGEVLRVGDHPLPANADAAELAAWTSVARVLLNLHETITRN